MEFSTMVIVAIKWILAIGVAIAVLYLLLAVVFWALFGSAVVVDRLASLSDRAKIAIWSALIAMFALGYLFFPGYHITYDEQGLNPTNSNDSVYYSLDRATAVAEKRTRGGYMIHKQTMFSLFFGGHRELVTQKTP